MYLYQAIVAILIYLSKAYADNCTCVPYYQCSDDYTNLITDGANILEIREQLDTKCTDYFDVCCNTNNKESNGSEELEPKQEVQKGCGYQTSSKFPWSVMIYSQKRITSAYQYKCSGSLIHPKVVVTAAHCTANYNSYILSVKLGPTRKKPETVVIHPKYNSVNMQNDLALIILKSPFQMNEVINLICIPPPGLILDDDSPCVVSLWKNTLFSSTTPYLKHLKIPLVTKTNCVDSLRNTRLGIFFQLHKSFLCAGGEINKDTCIGDGGSPLLCPVSNQPGRYHQVGIVSWGIGCGESNIPGVYVNLGLFRGWIDQQMISKGLDISTYRY